MVFLDKFRFWISRNLAPLIFLCAYLVTVVLGNIIYWLPFGRLQLEKNGYTSAILAFETLFTPGFWLLLFLPFLVTPPIVMLVRKCCAGFLQKQADFIPEFSKFEYAAVTAVFYIFVLYSLFRVDAFSLFLSGADSVSSVEARFQIRNRLGFLPLVVLMSLLHFLSIYSLVRWMMVGGRFWIAATIGSAIFMSAFLMMLNMKWPILIFYAGLVLAVFVYAKRYAYLKTVVGGVLLISMYFMVSAFVFRLVPAPEQGVSVAQAPLERLEALDSTSNPLQGNEREMLRGEGSDVLGGVANVGAAAAYNAPMLMFNVVNRMAIIYPYYYQVFTKEGQVCGSVLAAARVGVACRPSTFIYTRMFNDSFNGRGTAPAAVHISGYALGGWPIALFALVCASVVLGLFASLPLHAASSAGALAITGGIVGYHFSQLPGEGPIFYDHGVFWVLLMLLMFKFWRWIVLRVGPKSRGE